MSGVVNLDVVEPTDCSQICGLPDTLQSWFLVQQLHIWMLLVRAKKEGTQGKLFYNQLVQFFWDDVEHKMLLMRVDDVTIKVATQCNTPFVLDNTSPCRPR